MATLLQICDLRFAATTLRSRVTAAIAKAAMDVLNEDPQTENHAARVKWAKAALSDARVMAERMMWGVLGNPTMSDKGDVADDGEVQWTVNSLIDTFAAAED